MRNVTIGLACSVLLALAVPASVQAQAPAEPNFLLIEKFTMAPGQSVNGALTEAQEWVTKMRATGEYRSVKLYMHNYGPELAVYILMEPRSWASIKTGADKFFASMPGIMDKPLPWGAHEDNILTEIPVP